MGRFFILYFISLVILFNISCLSHFYAAKGVCKSFSITKADKKLQALKGILRVNFVLILLFFLCMFVFSISVTGNGVLTRLTDLIFGVLLLLFFISTVFLFYKLNKTGMRRSPAFVIINILLFPIGFFEYSLADYFKQLILPEKASDETKDIKKALLQKFNTYNLCCSAILTVMLFCFLLSITNKSDNERLFYIAIMSLIIIIRTCGRAIEIIYAFYKDATKPYIKTSSLTNADRLQLAIRSFFELLIIFSGIYCILEQQFIIDYLFDFRYSLQTFAPRYIMLALIDSFKNGTIIGADFVLSSDSVNLPLNQFIRECIVAVFVILQTLTNLVLTLFSIARYTVNDGEDTNGQ